jgi:hypothetical protein
MPENQRGKAANETGRWVRLALVSSAVSLWLIYDMANATETPRQALMILHYVLLACALFALGGSLVKLISPK